MKYIFFTFQKEKYWIEVDDSNFAARQIVFSDGSYHVSAFEDCLAEGPVIETEIEEDIVIITKADFEKVWEYSTRDYRQTWKLAKYKYHINDYITATLMYYYPQGAIFMTDNVIINYKGKVKVNIHDELRMKVIGYDDTNMWIITR